MTRFVTFTGFLTADDPGIWGGAPIPSPTPPIFYPPSISGGPGSLPPSVMPPIYYPPQIWPNPPGQGGGGGIPTHPIHYPPVISGGPGSLPPYPMPPIALPPGGSPTQPIFLPGEPTHPIVLPPDPELGPGDKFIVYYNPKYGWVIVPVGGNEGSTPAPKPTK